MESGFGGGFAGLFGKTVGARRLKMNNLALIVWPYVVWPSGLTARLYIACAPRYKTGYE